MILQEHLGLISDIYDLPLRPERWPEILGRFAPVMGAKNSAILAIDPIYEEHRISYFNPGIPMEIIHEFHMVYGEQEKAEYTKIAADPKRGFISDMENLGITSLEEQATIPAVKWLMEKLGVRHRAASCLNLERIWSDLILLQFSMDRGPITAKEKETGAFFLGHFAKSVELGRSFSVLKSRFDGVLSALDHFHIGIFLLSPNGSVVVKNAEASRIIDAADGLGVSRDMQLQPLSNDDRDQLGDAIGRAIGTANAQDNKAETRMALARKSGDEEYLVEVSPLRDHNELESNFRGALVFVIDPAKTDVVSAEGLQQIYGLTNSESEVCKLLAEGMDTDEISDARNLSLETVRTYVKQVLRKTGVSNRAQLVRRALNINLPIDPSPKG